MIPKAEGLIRRVLITAPAACLLPPRSFCNHARHSLVWGLHCPTPHPGGVNYSTWYCSCPGCGDLWAALSTLQRPLLAVCGMGDSQSWQIGSAGTFESLNSKPHLPRDRPEMVRPFPITQCSVALPPHIDLHVSLTYSSLPRPPQWPSKKALAARGWQWQPGFNVLGVSPKNPDLCLKRCDNTWRSFPGVSDPIRHLFSIFRSPGWEQNSSSTCFFPRTYLVCRNGAFSFPCITNAIYMRWFALLYLWNHSNIMGLLYGK